MPATSVHSFHLRALYHKADRTMLGVLWLCQLYALALAPWHSTWAQALLVGGGTLLVMHLLKALIGGSRLFRCAMAAALMVMSALHINQSQGTVEMHFSIFVLLAFLIYYRDWLPIVVGAAVIAVHHLLFFYLQSQALGVWLAAEANWGLVFVHAGYVLVEAAVLVYLARQSYVDALEGEMLASMTTGMMGHADGMDLTRRAQLRTPMLDSFNGFVGQLDQLVAGVQGNLRQVSDVGAAVTAKAYQVREGADQQAAEANYMLQSMEALRKATAQVAHNADDAVRSARTVNEHAQQGNQGMQQIRQEVELLSDDLKETGGAVDSAAQLVSDIHQVIDVIKSVAAQTNLLALNAAIEAARAGEQGRGFAVVADEVRNLSQRTAASTTEIEDYINRLQRASASASQAMQRSQASAGRCSGSADAGARTLAGMVDEVTRISRLNDSIAAATQEQAMLGDDVSQHLRGVTSVAQTNAGQAVDLAEQAQRLDTLRVQLESQVQRFVTSPALRA